MVVDYRWYGGDLRLRLTLARLLTPTVHDCIVHLKKSAFVAFNDSYSRVSDPFPGTSSKISKLLHADHPEYHPDVSNPSQQQ